MGNIAGLDIGSTGCKVAVFCKNGDYLGHSYREYKVIRKETGHEIDGGVIWDAICETMTEAAFRFNGFSAVGVSSFGETFVMLDKNDTPVCPSFLYTDFRGSKECERLIELLSAEKIHNVTGINPHHMYSLPKLMWIKKNRPDLFKKTVRIMQIQDYIIYMLTGNARTDYSLATRTLGFDIHRVRWYDDIFSAAGIDSSLFSEPVPIGSSAGEIKPVICEKLGLSAGTIVVAAGQDQTAASIGCGTFDGNITVNCSGTVECISPVYNSFDSAKMSKYGYAVIPYIIPGKYITYAFVYSGGALVKWFVDNLAGFSAAEAASGNVPVYSLLENRADTEPTGILVLPHFAGAATPYMDSGSKGSIIGLTLSHGEADVYTAILEGICYEMRLNIERLKEAGITVQALRATGGGAKSKKWLQMKADVLNTPVSVQSLDEAGAIGCAMLAGIAAGVFNDLAEASEVMVKTGEVYLPRVEMHKKYSRVYERYKLLYDAVRPLV